MFCGDDEKGLFVGASLLHGIDKGVQMLICEVKGTKKSVGEDWIGGCRTLLVSEVLLSD